MVSELPVMDLTSAQFDAIRALLHNTCGINLTEGKENLVKSRLMRRIRTLGMSNFEEYLKCLEADFANRERTILIDALTTNKTSFFRENAHFTFMRSLILPRLIAEKREIKIWSAGCSTGEEPYSIGMELMEAIAGNSGSHARILATDISTRVLKIAQEGVYGPDEVRDIPANLRQKYFTCAGTKTERSYQVKGDVKRMVRFAPLNLMGDWPMKGPFSVIFCRNVMIYFEKPTQQWLVQRFWQLLEPGGYLLVGHSESLTASGHKFRYVQPATYMK